MGKSKSPDIPPPPSFQANANVNPNIDFLSDVGLGLARGGFLPGRSGGDVDLSFLNPLVELNPEVTQQAVGLASRDVIRARDTAQQNILNQLEANNQLTSSVTGNRLADLNEQFSGDIADIATTFYLADVERSLSNTASLFELGLNTTGQATNLGLSDQGQRNEFALQNYNNQVAASLAANQASGRGGLLGGGLGTLLGGGIGFLAGGPAGAAIGAGLGGAAGGSFGEAVSPSASGTGGGFIQGGFGLAGAGAGNLFQPTNTFGAPTGQADIGLNNRLLLQQQRAVGGLA